MAYVLKTLAIAAIANSKNREPSRVPAFPQLIVAQQHIQKSATPGLVVLFVSLNKMKRPTQCIDLVAKDTE